MPIKAPIIKASIIKDVKSKKLLQTPEPPTSKHPLPKASVKNKLRIKYNASKKKKDIPEKILILENNKPTRIRAINPKIIPPFSQ